MLRYEGPPTDVDNLEKELQKVEITDTPAPETLEVLFSLYPGGYLEENYYIWAENKKDELESRFISAVIKITDYLLTKNRLMDAHSALSKLITLCPFQDYPYKKLIQLYRQMRNWQGEENTYQAYCKMMQNTGVRPEPKEKI